MVEMVCTVPVPSDDDNDDDDDCAKEVKHGQPYET